MSADQPANNPTTTGGDIDYRDPIECEYSLTECRHPVCDCPRKESHTTEPDWDEGNTQMWVGPQPAQNSPTPPEPCRFRWNGDDHTHCPRCGGTNIDPMPIPRPNSVALAEDRERVVPSASEGDRDINSTTREQRYSEALQRIADWSDAYPFAVFPKPDLKRAHEVLTAAGMTLDAVSADAMRHVVYSVGKIAKEALNDQ